MIESWGRADVVVSGGGFAGAAAAWSLGRLGRLVTVLEPTPSLGREIVRQRLQKWDADRAAEHSPFARVLRDELDVVQGRFGAEVDPFATALALDRVLSSVAVTSYFGAITTEVIDRANRPLEVHIASKDGHSKLASDGFIDASRFGRALVQHVGGRSRSGAAYRLELFYADVQAVGTPLVATIPVSGLGAVSIIEAPTFWPGESRVTATFELLLEEGAVARAITELTAAIAEHAPHLRGAVFAGASDEVASDSDFVLAPLDPRGRLVGAGPWMEEFPAGVSMEHDYVSSLIAAGEHAASELLQRQLTDTTTR